MGARRIVVKQDQQLSLTNVIGSRSFKIGMISLMLVTFGLFVAKLNRPDTLPFKTVQIVGQLNWINKNDLNDLVVKNLNGGFFSLDVNNLKKNLEDQAWIESAGIRRIWPDVLQISVEEQQPIAIWNDHSVVNKDGNLFNPDPRNMPDQIIKLYGPKGSYLNLIAQYRSLTDLAESVGLKIGSISLNDRRALQVELQNGVRLLLGRVRNVDESSAEMQRFVYAFKASLASKLDRVTLVDLRYTNGLAVRWKEQSQPDQQNQMQSAAGSGAAQG